MERDPVRMYLVKLVQNAKGQWGPKTNAIMVDGVDWFSANGETLTLVAPLQSVAGALLNNYYFLKADVANQAKLIADVDHLPLPDFAASTTWASIPNAEKNVLKARLPEFGFTGPEVLGLDNKATYREVVNAMIQKLQGAYNIDIL